MVHSTASDDQKAELFDSLAEEGFQVGRSSESPKVDSQRCFLSFFSHNKASQLLPRGWVYQRTAQRTLNFLNKEGIFLTTMEKALTYFSTCGEYSLEEVDRFRRFAKEEGVSFPGMAHSTMLENSSLATSCSFSGSSLTSFSMEEVEEGTSISDPNQSTFMSGMMNPSELSASMTSSSSTLVKSEPRSEPITTSGGWTCNGTARGCVAPSGKQFRSKRAALEHLLSTGAPLDQVQILQKKTLNLTESTTRLGRYKS